MKYFTTNNGIQIPAIGMGTNTVAKQDSDYWGDLNGDYRSIYTAIKAGYRMFDSARHYRNEGGIGNTIYESGVPREEFFIISKVMGIPECIKDEQSVRATVEDTLRLLRTDYIDLYMIHHPWSDMEGMVATYKVLMKLREEGKFRCIGVSNFTPDLLEVIRNGCGELPAVNEYQINPFDWHDETTEYCQTNGVIPIAWGPLLGISNFGAGRSWTFTPDLVKMLIQRSQGKAAIEELNRYSGYTRLVMELAEKYGRSWSQMQLRYNYQAGIISIPKSFNPEHQKANLEALEFEITDEDFQLMHDAARGLADKDRVQGAMHAITHKDAKMAGDI